MSRLSNARFLFASLGTFVFVCDADAKAAELDWQAPSNCPTREAVVKLAGTMTGKVIRLKRVSN